MRIPENITSGVRRELTAAVERTGWTPELIRAAEMLPIILGMSPTDFEKYSVSFYQRS